MQTPPMRIATQILGIILIIAGVVGLFLPFLQGILFLAIGVYLLSIASPRFKTWIDGHLMRFPKVKAHVDRQHERLSRIFKKKQP
ncbi:MAG: hypothetical protein WC767_00205 [Candidatus Paceibacterota bacterium]|jgi:uncharacterized membrane protein YbaN (DUF454 family)